MFKYWKRNEFIIFFDNWGKLGNIVFCKVGLYCSIWLLNLLIIVCDMINILYVDFSYDFGFFNIFLMESVYCIGEILNRVGIKKNIILLF